MGFQNLHHLRCFLNMILNLMSNSGVVVAHSKNPVKLVMHHEQQEIHGSQLNLMTIKDHTVRIVPGVTCQKEDLTARPI